MEVEETENGKENILSQMPMRGKETEKNYIKFHKINKSPGKLLVYNTYSDFQTHCSESVSEGHWRSWKSHKFKYNFHCASNKKLCKLNYIKAYISGRITFKHFFNNRCYLYFRHLGLSGLVQTVLKVAMRNL